MNIAKHNLVFLPGWGYRASVMSSLMPHLQDYHSELHDLPELTFHNLAKFAATLPAESTLIGWSLGGLIAIQLCSLFPDQFKKLILLASSPKFLADDHWCGISAEQMQKFYDSAALNIRTTLTEFRKLTCYPSHSRVVHRHFTAHACERFALLQTSLEYLFTSDFRTMFSGLKQPHLAIAGANDAVLPAGEINDQIIADAGHGFFFTHPELTSHLILDFLEEH